MKIKHLLILLTAFYFSISGCWAQSQPLNKYAPNIFPQTPNAASLGKYGDYPVSMFTGVPDISIPIYVIKGSKLQLPISLSYHAAGIKVSDLSSWVGLSWTLRAGSAITRKINGKRDEEENGYLKIPLRKDLDGVTCYTDGENIYWKEIESGIKDNEPDLFQWSLPNGKSGSFYFKSNNITDIVNQPVDAVKIIVNNNNLEQFKIIDTDGTIYYFGMKSASEKYIDYVNSNNIGFVQSAWQLYQIESGDNADKIYLKYEQASYQTDYDVVQTVTIKDNGTNTFIGKEDITTASKTFRQVSTTNSENKLSEIIFNNGKVVFKKDTSLRKDLADYALAEIIIQKQIDSSTYSDLRRVGLTHTYYNNGIAGKERLRLDEVVFYNANKSKVENKYKLFYNTTALPKSSSFQRDYWGYYNGATNNDTNQDLFPPFSIPTQIVTTVSTTTLGNANRNPDSTYMKAGILEKIVFPTGGFTIFKYEPNSYISSNGNRIVGGLRVRQTLSYAETDASPIIKTYKYKSNSSDDVSGDEGGRLNANALINDWMDREQSFRTSYIVQRQENHCVPDGSKGILRIRTYSTNPVVSATDLTGAAVVYPKVIEYNGTVESNSGYTVHLYKDLADYYAAGALPISGVGPAKMGNFSWSRGQLLKKISYSTAGKKRSVTENIYKRYSEVDNDKIGLLVYQAYSNSYDCTSFDQTCPYNDPNYRQYYFSYFSYKTGVEKLDKTIETVYGLSDTDVLQTSISYDYNTYNLQPQRIISQDSKNQFIKQTLKYPVDLSASTYVGMKNKNIIDPVIMDSTYINKSGDQLSWSFLKSVKTDYDIFLNSFYAPKEIITSQFANIPYSEITFNEYNSNGDLTKFTERNGLVTVIDYYTTEPGIKNLLKSKISGFGSSSPQTTTYTYEPLVGLKSIKDANNKLTSYAYDDFGRVTSIEGPSGKKEYTYHYANETVSSPLTAAAGISEEVPKCELCCKVEAEAKSNSPIVNCASGQVALNAGSSTTGTDVTYSWVGPNQFKSNLASVTISGDLSKAAGVYTLTVTRSNSSCEAKDVATTEVILDCSCPFTVNTNGTSTGPLNCYETISLVANCQGCSVGTVAAGSETYVNNGKFDSGDTGFNCDAANRYVTNYSQSVNGSFAAFGDHTGNIGGNMLMVGHSTNTEEKVYYQTITVKPNTRYIMSAWVAGAYNNNPTKVYFNMDGSALTEVVDLTNYAGGVWNKLESVWTSKAGQTSVIFAISKQNAQGHNWFCLDDITFTEAPMAEYIWSGPDGFLANGKNQYIRPAALKNSGTYTLKVTDNGCTKIINTPVTVNCPACTQPITVTTYTNSPISCGNTIQFFTSSSPGVSYNWFKINPDGTFTDFADPVERVKKDAKILAPTATGTNRYTYGVEVRKAGCTAVFTTPVTVKCEPLPIDISLSLRPEGGSVQVSANQVFPICADMKNEGQGNAFSVRGRVLLPDCIEFVSTNSPWGLNTGNEPNTGGYYEDIWYNPVTREVSNDSPISRRGADYWRYWGVPIGAGATRSMCFYVKALQSGTIVLKGQISDVTNQYGKAEKDADSEPNNGYDNGEDDRAELVLNPNQNTIDVSSYQILAGSAAYTSTIDVTSTNSAWTSEISDPSWILLDYTTGLAGTKTVTLNLPVNNSAKSRYGTIKFKIGCGVEKIVRIRQAGREDCPSVDVSSNNPFCGDPLKLFSQIVPAASKDLVTNGDFESGNTGFSPEAFHIYNSQQGGTLSYIVSATPKSESGGLAFLNQECQTENSNPVCSVMNRVRVMWRSDCCQDRQNGATIQGSNNGVWDVLYTFGNAPITGGWQDISIPNTKKYANVRFVASPNGYGDLAEIEFYSGSTKLSGRLLGSPGVWAGQIATYQVSNAVDGNASTIWNGSSPGLENYVGYELDNCGIVPNPAGDAGFGKQMAVVASWKPDGYFWSQTINVDPSTDYVISAKTALLGNYSNGTVKLSFEVDGVPVNIEGMALNSGCAWKKISGIWNSGQKFGPVKLSIKFENPGSGEKAFAIDDISVKASTVGTISTATVTYLWTGPGLIGNDPEQFKPNPVIANSDASKSGKYTLTVTQNGCSSSETVDVTIGCTSQTCPAPSISANFNVLCANMDQAATLTAVGCPAGSTVVWSDGQTGASISTPKLVNSTIYSARCQTACGFSIKSNEITIHVIAPPEPPGIIGALTVYRYPGTEGFNITATGCINGTIRWSDGQIGSSMWVSGNLADGTILTYTAKCITECGESANSASVRVVVRCDVKEPQIKIISLPNCIVGGGDAVLEGSCENGTLVWYKEVYRDGQTVEENLKKETNRISVYIDSKTVFKARCFLPGSCVSSAVRLIADPSIKPNTPWITSFPTNPENGSKVTIPLNSTITLTANGCPAGAEVVWNMSNYSPTSLSGNPIQLTPAVAGEVTARVSCITNGICISDPSEYIHIYVEGTCNEQVKIYPVASEPQIITKGVPGSQQQLVAKGCKGVIAWYLSDEKGDKKIKETTAASVNDEVVLNIPTDQIGDFKYVACCSGTTCPSAAIRTVKIVESVCGLTASLSALASCEYVDFTVDVLKNGNAYNNNVNYEWFLKKSQTTDPVQVVNALNTYKANDNGEYWYYVKVTDKGNTSCTVTTNEISAKILKYTANPSISVITPQVSNGLIEVSKQGTVKLSAVGCPSFAVPSWSYPSELGAESTISTSATEITFNAFTKTTDYKVQVKCVIADRTNCTTILSDAVTIRVRDLPCEINISSPVGNPAKATKGVPLTLTATGCGNGTITWKEGNTVLGVNPQTVTKSTVGTYTFTAVCNTSGGATCTKDISVDFSCSDIPNLSYSNPKTKVCKGQSITLGASGCTGGTISWYDNEALSGPILGTGSTLTTTKPKIWAICNQNGCNSPSAYIETQSDLAAGNVGIYPNCDFSQLTVYPSSGYKYKWNKVEDPGFSSTSAVVPASLGTFYVEVANDQGCSQTVNYIVSKIQNWYPVVTLNDGVRNGCSNDFKFIGKVENLVQIPNKITYDWYEDTRLLKTLDTIPTNQTTQTLLIGSNNATYKFRATNVFEISGHTITCSGEASKNLTLPPALGIPTINSNAYPCVEAGKTTTLTASCTNGASVKWSTGVTAPSITAGVGTYTAQCVLGACSGVAASYTVTQCPPPDPGGPGGGSGSGNCISPINDIVGNAANYEQIFEYKESTSKQLTVTFEVFCIPDNLFIYTRPKTDPESNWTLVISSGCIGNGLPAGDPQKRSWISSPGIPTLNLIPGYEVKIVVSPSCRPDCRFESNVPCFNCDAESTQWKVSFACTAAN